MGESRIIPTLYESGVHGWIWGQVISELRHMQPACEELDQSNKQQATSNKLDKGYRI